MGKKTAVFQVRTWKHNETSHSKGNIALHTKYSLENTKCIRAELKHKNAIDSGIIFMLPPDYIPHHLHTNISKTKSTTQTTTTNILRISKPKRNWFGFERLLNWAWYKRNAKPSQSAMTKCAAINGITSNAYKNHVHPTVKNKLKIRRHKPNIEP